MAGNGIEVGGFASGCVVNVLKLGDAPLQTASHEKSPYEEPRQEVECKAEEACADHTCLPVGREYLRHCVTQIRAFTYRGKYTPRESGKTKAETIACLRTQAVPDNIRVQTQYSER
jgi:hypothetical protein